MSNDKILPTIQATHISIRKDIHYSIYRSRLFES